MNLFFAVALPENAQHHLGREELDHHISVADRHFETFHQTRQGRQIRPMSKEEEFRPDRHHVKDTFAIDITFSVKV